VALEPLSVIYWTRALTGIVMGAVCVLLQMLVRISPIICILLTITVYSITQKIYKRIYQTAVEDKKAITTTGAEAYILLWLVTWILLYTFLVSPP